MVTPSANSASGPILVTGSRGRLATHLAASLAVAGFEVVRVSRTAGEGHISYADLWASGLLKHASCLLHCAWSSLPSTAELNPASIWTEDLPLLARLADAGAQRPDPHSLQLVFMSSGGAIYGECLAPARETDATAPIGWYGAGKSAAEEMLATFAARKKFRLSILRPSNPYGFTFTSDKPQGIVGAALQAVRSGRPLKLIGGGASHKDFLHIEDFDRAVSDCIRLRLEGTYNLCQGSSVSTLDVITQLEQLGGFSVPRTNEPPAFWDVRCSQLSREKFTAATAWTPAVDLREGLLRTLREAGFGS